MRRRPPTRSLLAIAMLLAAMLPARAPAAPSASGFDALFARIEAEPLWATTEAERTGRFERLRALLPADDAARALRYHALRCASRAEAAPEAVGKDVRRWLPHARASGDVASEIRLRYCSGVALEHGGGGGATQFDLGIELAARHRQPALLGRGLALRALSASARGEQAAALIDLLQAERAFAQAGLDGHARHARLGIAMAYRRMGDHGRALGYLDRAGAGRAAADDWVLAYETLLQRGYLLLERGDARGSLSALQQAVSLAEREGSAYRVAIARIAYAASLTRAGEPARALPLFARAERALGATDANRDLLHLRRGEALAMLGRHVEALADFGRAYPGFARGGNLRHLAALHRARAASLESVGDRAGALAEYRRHVAAGTELERRTRVQQDALLRHQLDAERLEFEHRRLVAQQALQDRRVQAATYERRWQGIAMTTGATLLLVLVALGLHQWRRQRRLRVLAMTDPLTGIANRRRLERFAAESLAAARRDGGTLTVLALDIDRFKPINDRHGHAVGDEVLRRVATACEGALRPLDMLGRTGGEEFVIVLPGTATGPARRVAERLRSSVEALDLSDLVPGLAVTVSLGAAEARVDGDDVAALLHRADVALYRAKQLGRNRVEVDDGRFEPAPLPDEVAALPLVPRTAAPVDD